MEEYKDIFGTDYEISTLAQVRNKKTQRILKPWNRGKYLAVNLGIHNPFYIHKIMELVFLEPIESYDVDHINRDKHDNRLSNLRIVSKSVNRTNTLCLPTNKLQEKNISQKGNTFSVRIFREGKYVYIKSFDTLEEAKQARDNFINSNY